LGTLLHKVAPWRSMDYTSLGFDPDKEVRLGSEEFLGRVRGRREVLLAGWRLRDWQLFEKHQAVIRRFLMPAERFRRIAEGMIRDLRQRHDVLVGLLIRQDDYRLWCGGKFFFTTEQYRGFLLQLRERYGPRAAFVVAADERQPEDAFAGLDVHLCTGAMGQPGHYMPNSGCATLSQAFPVRLPRGRRSPEISRSYQSVRPMMT
jgi:hypothetical protein